MRSPHIEAWRFAWLRKDAPLNIPDTATFYVPGAKGYTDYPVLQA